MINILCALRAEAEEIIKKYRLKKIHDKPFEIFISNDVRLIISGIGKVNAAGATAFILSDLDIDFNSTDIFINFGICGALQKEYVVVELILCNKVLDYEMRKNFFTDILIDYGLYEASIQTINNLDEQYDFLEDLVDMEASAAFKMASKFLYTHQIYVLKIVSDLVYEKSNERISRGFVKNLVKNKIETIINFVDVTESFLKNNPPFFQREDLELIEEVSNSLKLTFSQQEQLKNAYCFYKSQNRCEPAFLKDYLIIKPENSKERNVIFDQIKHQLYS
jgi:nucleoside phosphorylase